MRFFILLIFVVAFYKVRGQSKPQKEPFGLVMPRGVDEQPAFKDLSHSILVEKGYATLTLLGKKNKVSYKDLPAYFKLHKYEIRRKELSIIEGQGATYKAIVDVLDLIAINAIQKYKILGKIEDKLTTQAPVSVEKVEKTYEGKITILDQGYNMSYKGEELLFRDSASLDQFISKNSEQLRRQTIGIAGDENMRVALALPVMAILRRNELYHYDILTIASQNTKRPFYAELFKDAVLALRDSGVVHYIDSSVGPPSRLTEYPPNLVVSGYSDVYLGSKATFSLHGKRVQETSPASPFAKAGFVA